MAQITHKGNIIHTTGELPRIGSKIPDFRLTKNDLNEVTLAAFAGKKKILNIVPSLDTGVCATSARTFDREATKLSGTVVLTVSADLPFAQKRFCQTEDLKNVETLSVVRDRDFGKRYGLEIKDGLLEGLLSRSIIVVDANDTVIYTEQVPEITQEPDYGKALSAASR